MRHIRDIDIRDNLRKNYLNKYDDGDSKVIEEFGILWGNSIADIAVVNGSLHAYEIKSEVDTLDRFEKQFTDYNKVFDFTSIIIHETHYEKYCKKYRDLLPNWGVFLVSGSSDEVIIKKRRKPKLNKKTDIFSICHLLWKDEAIEILKEYGINKGLSTKKKKDLYHILCDQIDVDILKDEIRRTIKNRENWRVVV